MRTFLQQMLGMAGTANVNDERNWTTWGGPTTAAGVGVSPETALKVSTVYACVRLISDTIGMLPLIVYERMPNDGRRRAVEHPLYSLLHSQPNATQTAFQFKKQLTIHALLHGNAYARLMAGARGFVDQLQPLNPHHVTPEKTPDGRLRYRYRPPNAQPETLSDDEVFHLRGMTLDGVTGVGVIAYARETVGFALARERYGARFFANNSQPGGVLRHPGKLKDAKALKASWEEAHANGNAHRIAVLEEGMEYVPTSLSNKDSQFIEAGESTAEQIAGQYFGVPPHMVGLTSKSTSWGSGLEEQNLGYITFTAQPWMTEWEQSSTRDLLIAPQKYFIEFLPEALLRGRMLDRYNAYQIARNNGWMNADEIRHRENMNPLPDGAGQVYLQPLNMQPVGEPPLRAGGSNTERLRAIAQESAARVVRKEVAALTKAANRGRLDAELAEFYGEHAGFVAQTLAVPLDVAQRWANEQQAEIAEHGAQGMGDWETRRTAALVALVLGER